MANAIVQTLQQEGSGEETSEMFDEVMETFEETFAESRFEDLEWAENDVGTVFIRADSTSEELVKIVVSGPSIMAETVSASEVSWRDLRTISRANVGVRNYMGD